MKFYSYWKSSCAWRVRIALHFKGLEYEYIAVNLLKGQHFSSEFQKLNPLGYVPVLVDGDVVVADSLAILMYLDEKYPQYPLLPQDLQKKAINFQVASIVAANMQPFQNLTVLNYIEEKIGSGEKLNWAHHHLKKGYAALVKLLKGYSAKYAIGDEIALADLFLAPQIAAAKWFNIDLAEFPLMARLEDAYSEIPAFQNAVPEKQPDAQQS